MLRFIHASDFHLTAGKFFDETLRCLQFIWDVACSEDVDAVLLPGDFTHSDLPHRVQTPAERNVLADVITRWRPAPALLTYGNHDIGGDLDVFRWLPNVDVFTRAELDQREGFDLLAVPYPHKRHWLARREAGAIDAQRQELGQTLGQALRGLVQQRRPGVPLIGLAHLNIAGSRLGGGEVLIGQEIELAPADLNEIGCDYWALGHIHQPQQMAERAWYAGTPQPHSFGDSNVNGCNLVEIEAPGKPPRVTFIDTPATKLITQQCAWCDGEWRSPLGFDEYLIDAVIGPDHTLSPSDAAPFHLRVVANVDETEREGADWAQLEKMFRVLKSLQSLRIERRIIPQTRVRSEQIRAAHTVAEKLAAYFETLTPAPPPEDQAGALAALAEL